MLAMLVGLSYWLLDLVVYICCQLLLAVLEGARQFYCKGPVWRLVDWMGGRLSGKQLIVQTSLKPLQNSVLCAYCCWSSMLAGTHSLPFSGCNYHSIPLSLRYFRIPILFWWLEEDKGGWVNLFCITQIDYWSILLKCLHLFWTVLGDDADDLWCSVFADERLLSVTTSRSADAGAISARMICKAARSAQVGE